MIQHELYDTGVAGIGAAHFDPSRPLSRAAIEALKAQGVEVRIVADPEFEAKLDAALGRLRETLLSKRADYGTDPIRDFGLTGILVRAGDKYHRLRNLMLNQQQPKHEAIDDTWLDLAGYAVLALTELAE